MYRELLYIDISLSIISTQLKSPPAKQSDLVAKLVYSVVGLQMSSSLRGETFCAFNNAGKLSFFSSHKHQTERIKPREKKPNWPRWSGQYDMISNKTKDKLCKSLSDQQLTQWSGSRAVQVQEDLRKQLLDTCFPLTTQLHCCLSVTFCCDSNTLCPFAWKQNQSFRYPQIIRIYLVHNFLQVNLFNWLHNKSIWQAPLDITMENSEKLFFKWSEMQSCKTNVWSHGKKMAWGGTRLPTTTSGSLTAIASELGALDG